MVTTKKRITTELLHIALVITLLRGNPRHVGIYDNVISSNFFNDVDNFVNIDQILQGGPTWAFSRTNYHRLGGGYHDPGIEYAKSLSGNFDPFHDDNIFDGQDIHSSYNNEDDRINLAEEAYRQQSRLLLLSNLNAAYVRKDPIQMFRDITAYLVSDTTTESIPSGLAGLPVVPPASSSSSGGSSPGGNNGGSGNIVPTGSTSPTPSSGDSGNDSGTDSGDESGRNSESEPDLSEPKLDEPYFELFESTTPLSPDPFDPFLVAGVESEEAGPSTSTSSLGRNSPQENYLDRLNAGLNVETDDFDSNELLDFIISNHQTAADAEDAEQQGAASLPLRPSSPSSHLFRSLDDNLLLEQSLVADLFDLRELKPYSPSGNDQTEEMEWTLAEEEAHLDFYKTFNEAANEVMRTVPLREVEGRLSPEQHQVPEVAGANEGTASSSSTSAASTVPEITLEDVIDDWLETDSGVFDFLGSSATTPSSIDGRRNTFDIDSIPSLGSVESDLELDGGDQATSPNQSEEDEDVDMIQAAPTIHGGRPTPHPHPAQPRGFQVHARMPGLLRGGSSMDQRWQDVVTFLNLQQGNGGHPHGDGSGGPLPLSHTFGSHLHHHGAPLHHHHHHHFSAPPPSAPYNADSARSVLLQNATLPPPDVSSPYSMGPPPNIGSAVASSMHLTNSSDPMIDPSLHYKMIEQSHDMIYYPNTTNNAEMNNQSTTDGLFSTVEDDLQLQFVDMSALNEGIHQMRMLDYGVGASISNSLEGAASLPHGPQQQNLPNGCSSIGMTTAEDRLEASSDSAVSSMGSERVPPMTDPSDSEWVDPDSHPHSSHDSSPYSLDYPGTKGRGYEYYGKDRVPVAQKKHHMFGKRFQQEQGPYVLPPHHNSLPLPYPSASGLHSSPSLDSMDLKYGCGVEFARHQNDLRANGGLGLDSVHNNHTYALPPNHGNSPLTTFKAPKPPMKDKQPKMSEDLDRFAEDSLSRDDKRARAMNLPITTEDIINLPMDEFNERLSKFDLSEPQLSLIRDIRRRGKNKVAAQNCRKRKLDQIMQLADEVQTIRERKQSLLREQQELGARRHDLKERYQLLYRHVFQALRDPEGNPYSIYEYNLAQAADGSIMMERQRPVHPSNGDNNNPSRRDKSKDDYNNKKAE